MKKYCILFFALAVLWIMPADAGDRVDLLFTNSLNEEIVDIRVKYASAYAEDGPRHTSTRVNLPPGAENWRKGVQGVTLPEVIIFDLATKSYVFDDLSGLSPANEMFLEAAHEDGIPVLRRTDGDGEAAIQGVERDYLTALNRPNAVDRDFLTSVTTWGEVGELVAETVSRAQEEAEGAASISSSTRPKATNTIIRTRW